MMLRAGLWAFAGKGGHQVVNFAVVIILARQLTPEAFGVVAAAQVVLVFCQVVVKFGLGAALIQTDGLTRGMERTAITLMMVMALVMAGALHLATPWLARLMTIPELVDVMPVMLSIFILSAATNPGMNLLMRDMRFKLLAAIDVGIFALLYSVIAVALAFAGWSYWAIILANLVSTAAQAAVVWYIRPVWPTIKMQRGEVKALLGFGSGLFLANLMINVAQKADNVVVSSQMGVACLGVYSRAFSLMEIVNSLFGGAFRTILFSGFSKQRRENLDREKQRETFFLSQAFVGLISIPFMVLVSFLSPEIVSVLLGPQWAGASQLLPVFALGLFFRLAYKAAIAIPQAEGHVLSIAALNTVYAIFVSIAAYLASPYGLVAISWAVLAAIALHYVMVITLALKILREKWRNYLRSMLVLLPLSAPSALTVAFLAPLVRTYTDGSFFGDILVIASITIAFVLTAAICIAVMRNEATLSNMLRLANGLRNRKGEIT